jgi:hypothetical protein
VCPDAAAGTALIVRVAFGAQGAESYEVKLSADPAGLLGYTGFGQGLYVAIGDWTLRYAKPGVTTLTEVKLTKRDGASGASYASADGGVTVTVIEGKDPLASFPWWIVGTVAGALLLLGLLVLLFALKTARRKGRPRWPRLRR